MTPDDENLEKSDPPDVRRQARQRLESLKRAGIDRVPKATVRSQTRSAAKADKDAPPEPEAVAPPAPVAAATPPPSPVAAPRSLFDAAGAEPAGPILPANQRPAALEVIEREVAGCPRCPELVATRNRTVFGEGSPTARLMFIGEAPGADEDRTGRPFVGRAGQLLTDMITKGMGLTREDVFIANVLKCRPPANRTPLVSEVANCRGYLVGQLQIIRPEFLCLLGKTAAAALLDIGNKPMRDLRGRWFEVEGIKTLITYHPAYLLRNPASKRETWEDLQLLMSALGLPTPRKS